MAALYRAPPAGALLAVPLDLLTAFYHRPSGQTHLVVAPVPEILAALSDAPMSADALLSRLAERFDLADGEGDRLVARLDELVAAGLVERL